MNNILHQHHQSITRASPVDSYNYIVVDSYNYTYVVTIKGTIDI